MAPSKADLVFAAMSGYPPGYMHCKACCRRGWNQDNGSIYELTLHHAFSVNERTKLVRTLCTLCDREDIYSLDAYESLINHAPLPENLKKWGYVIKER